MCDCALVFSIYSNRVANLVTVHHFNIHRAFFTKCGSIRPKCLNFTESCKIECKLRHAISSNDYRKLNLQQPSPHTASTSTNSELFCM